MSDQWERIQSTADMSLLGDPFDTWEQFEKVPSDDEIEQMMECRD